jgi:3-oxoacyl-[acyl-carrier protein] reductase
VNEDRNLQGQVAIVTGSARNIGRAIARALAEAGASVVINAKSSAADADAVVREIRETGGQAVAKIADVGQPEAAASLIDAAIAAFGRLDILVNNAAVRREMDFERLDYHEWRAITATILDGAYLCAHAASPHLIAAGGGSIVNIGGLSSFTGAARRAHVIAAKTGLIGLTRALAHDLAPHRITVNCVAPGLIDTERRGPEPGHHAKYATLVGRRGSPEEIAAVVRFLCGPGARYITGQTLHANGGVFMG